MSAKEGYLHRARGLLMQGYAEEDQVTWLADQLEKADKYDVLMHEQEPKQEPSGKDENDEVARVERFWRTEP